MDMSNPFEAPKAPKKPEEDESVDVYVGDFDTEFGTGLKDLELEDPTAERQERAADEAAAAFFADGKNAYFMKRFGNDPGALARFKEGLKEMMKREGGLDLEAFRASPKFKMELVKYSFAFEDEEDRRKKSRAA
jgi:hypothetical protein